MQDEPTLEGSERAAMLARLDAMLLRPGEVHTDDWEGYVPEHDGPPISLWWFEVAPDDRPNAQLESDDNWSRAWDGMMNRSEFRRWYETHHQALRAGENEVLFEPRPRRHMRLSAQGNLVLRVPIDEVWGSDDELAVHSELILLVLGRRAEAVKVPPPPK
jgi:hypothetical protein